MQPQNIHRSRTVDAGTMQNELAAFKDPKLARGLIESIVPSVYFPHDYHR